MTEGYIAVVLPRLHEVDDTLSKLMTEADYEVLQNQRKMSNPALAADDKLEGHVEGIVSQSTCTELNIEPES